MESTLVGLSLNSNCRALVRATAEAFSHLLWLWLLQLKFTAFVLWVELQFLRMSLKRKALRMYCSFLRCICMAMRRALIALMGLIRFGMKVAEWISHMSERIEQRRQEIFIRTI